MLRCACTPHISQEDIMPIHARRFVVAAAVVVAAMLSPVTAASSASRFPRLIPLPTDFGPEGIAAGTGMRFYVGSLGAATRGQILSGDLRTGELSELVAATGVPATGMKHDARSNLLFVARAGSGTGAVYDAASGEQIAVYEFQPPSPPAPAAATTFINDVVVTRDAAFFTDSAAPFIYRVALGPRGEPASDADRIPAPAGGNGIAATPSGSHLFLVDSNAGQLYLMDPATFAVAPIDLGGDNVQRADGLLRDGTTRYGVQNFLNRVAVVELAPDHLSGTITRYITEPFASNPATRVPTTIAEFGNSLYAVTAGFAPPSPDFVVQLTK
jgi:sugar lactone lactonase YvrE